MTSDPSSPTETLPNADEAFSDLEMPDMTLKGLMSHFGPGVILMMTGIGTSHLVTAPAAGGATLMPCSGASRSHTFSSITASRWPSGSPTQPERA